MIAARSLAQASLLTPLLLASCSLHAGDGTCVRTQTDVCVEGPATRNISGLDVHRDCWRYEARFSCQSVNPTDDCRSLRDRGCSQIGSRCVETGPEGACLVHEQAYQCRLSHGATSTVTHCGTQQFCVDGRCFDTGHSPDQDFAKAVTALEAQREAGKYLDPTTLEVFKGHDNRCRKKLGGLVNCCKGGGSDPALFSNANLIMGAGGKALNAVGSSYAYDALFTSDAPNMVIAGFEALFGAGGGSSALAGLLAGDLSVELFVQSLVPGPWTLAMLAIQLSGILSCEKSEQVLAMKRDNRLCHGIGSYCSLRVPILGICLETTESYCCFNSRLARIVHEQGRAQLGMGWGGARDPNCHGFTLPQLQALDFARMDLSEFYAEIAPTLPDLGAMRSRAQDRIDSYFER